VLQYFKVCYHISTRASLPFWPTWMYIEAQVWNPRCRAKDFQDRLLPVPVLPSASSVADACFVPDFRQEQEKAARRTELDSLSGWHKPHQQQFHQQHFRPFVLTAFSCSNVTGAGEGGTPRGAGRPVGAARAPAGSAGPEACNGARIPFPVPCCASAGSTRRKCLRQRRRHSMVSPLVPVVACIRVRPRLLSPQVQTRHCGIPLPASGWSLSALAVSLQVSGAV